MSDEQFSMRAGDADRDDAVSLLQEHLTAGRLSHDEFDERISKALSAKTQQELRDLFTDLPGRRPGEAAGASRAPQDPPGRGFAEYPQTPGGYPAPVDHPAYGPGAGFAPPKPERPWFAQWWLLLVAIFVSGMSGGRLGPLVPMVIIWLWVVWPFLIRPRMGQQYQPRQEQAPYSMRITHTVRETSYPTHGSRPLTNEQRLQIEGALTYGNKHEAIRLYQEFTGAGIPEATQVVRTMQRELGG